MTANEQYASLRERVEAVRELHRRSAEKSNYPGGPLVPLCAHCDVSWPCPTIKALDGAE